MIFTKLQRHLLMDRILGNALTILDPAIRISLTTQSHDYMQYLSS